VRQLEREVEELRLERDVPKRSVVLRVGPEFGDPLASAQVDGDARKSVSTTRSVFFLLR
jgi:hypothetical protein